MNLAELQAGFMAQVLDEDAAPPARWNARHAAGMAIYRNNYRSSLIEALRSTFERTARWTGESAFERAAAHHLITNPPASWTLDEAGRGFDQTCAELFANDPEVEELAWLEWAMFEAFTAPDIVPLDAAGFAEVTQGFGDEDWANLTLSFVPASSTRCVGHDLRVIWNGLANDGLERPVLQVAENKGVLVWREGERSTFRLVDAEEIRAFDALRSGTSYGDICMLLASENASEQQAQEAAMRAGAMLGRWLNDGLIAAVSA